ncbi:MAG: undecaprenyldiphospho-muramoylpentapeptide beta-N-acetylglucosaminyltransferase [Gammaproteobacteria bacterium]|jgi:UDP-N-acetylglucosamine--N-acetylmuramyl-(pentapeptide) pyrophosphoryl-undecaprenol N-acetylglucosamine transferase|nr:undecaprenyldiphospho-muramoylpentapeptide beta-N-acetylglucosaminyltransferase [Gammaproteobacteria bacterium]MBQ0775350.1 undecaprenyldiphospho-muramoylpentapeptide beta-N-acetylglucosaminyltransferase [Gammaproteobacteria bacterium]
MRSTVLIMAGGTGGHVFPALTVAAVLRDKGYAIHWLGAENGIEERLVPPHDYPLNLLSISGVRGNGVIRKLLAPFKLLSAIIAAREVIRKTQPKLAIGFGGFASGPGGLAAKLSGVPLLIHEQNAVPGLTNRVLAVIARQVLQGFSGAFSNGVTVGNPVRPQIAEMASPEQRYGSRDGCLRVLVLGGSQGALALNRVLPAELARVAESTNGEIEIRHQAGRGRADEALKAYQAASLTAQVEEFIEDMAAVYAWADLVICRAGAATVAEVAAAGVATLFIPLPTAVDDHQTMNARWLSDQNAALLMPQSSLEQGALVSMLAEKMSRATLKDIAVRARAAAIIDSADKVASICQEVLDGE